MADFRINVIVDPNRAVAGTRRVRRELDRTSRAGNRLRRTILRTFGTLAAGLSVGLAIRQLTRLADAYTEIGNRLRLVTETEADLIGVRAELLGISQRTRTEFEANAQLYARLALSAENTTHAEEDLLRVTEILNQQVLIGGSNAAEARAGLIQFAQGLASGRLQGDELRSVLENLLGVQQGLIEGFAELRQSGQISIDVTRANIRELAAEGVLTPQLLLDAVLASADATERRFEAVNLTISGGLTRVANAAQEVVGTLDQALGISEGIGEALSDVADILLGTVRARIIADDDIAFLEALGTDDNRNPLVRLADRLNRIPVLGFLTTIPSDFEQAERAYLEFLRTIETAELNPDVIETQLEIAALAIERFAEGSRARDAARATIERLTGLTSENIRATVDELQRELDAQLGRIEQTARGRIIRSLEDPDAPGRPITRTFLAQLDALRTEIGALQELALQPLEIPVRPRLVERDPFDLVEVSVRALPELDSTRRAYELLAEGASNLASIDEDRERARERAEQRRIRAEEAAQTRALRSARAINRVRDRLVELGLEQRDVAEGARFWADEQRAAIDETSAAGQRALENIDRVLATYEALQSDDPLAGLSIGVDTVFNQLPSLAEEVRDATTGAFRQMEDTLVDFVRTGEFEFGALVDSIIADLARIAIRRALIGPLADALGGALAGAFGGGAGAASGGLSLFDTSSIPARLAGGGLVRGPGSATSDSIRARLSDGEFVVNAAATSRYLPLLSRINAEPRRFQAGGLVRPDGRLVVNVIDQRGRGNPQRRPPVEVERSTTGDRDEIRILVNDLISDSIDRGQFDSQMGRRYGATPQLR